MFNPLVDNWVQSYNKRIYQPNFLLKKNTLGNVVFPKNRLLSFILSIVSHHFTPLFTPLSKRCRRRGSLFAKLKVAFWMTNPVRVKKTFE